MTGLASARRPVPVRFQRVSKSYGAHRVLDEVDVELRPGAVTALLGPNGSGKTTALRLLLGLERPDSGQVLVGDTPYRRLRFPLQQVGALLDAAWVHPRRSARAHLSWLAQASAIPTARVAGALARVGLAEVADNAVGTFSLGMRQRLGIAATILGDPAVLVYDEPLNGLDQGGVAWIRQFLRDQADDGRTVLLSTHLLREVEQGADDIVVLAGRTVRYAGPAAGLGGETRGVDVDVADAEGLEPVLGRLAVEHGWSMTARPAPDGIRALTVHGAEVEDVVSVLSATAVRVRHARPSDSLADAYRRLTADLADHVGQVGQVGLADPVGQAEHLGRAAGRTDHDSGAADRSRRRDEARQ
ncbi:MAG: ATP-binding cassette domain-containing protein [Dermatophilaceae bacterium]